MTNDLLRRIREWFEQAASSSPATQTDLGRALGISPSAVTRILKGERQISLSEFVEAVRFFNAEPDLYDLLGLEEKNRIREYDRSIRHHITSGPVVIHNMGAYPPNWEIPRLCVGLRNEEDLRWFLVEDDNMSDFVKENDVVFVDSSVRAPSRPGIYTIDNGFGEVVVRRLDFNSSNAGQGAQIQVCSDNPRYRSYELPVSELKVLGRCFAIYRRGF